MKVLMVGDIVGGPGRRIFRDVRAGSPAWHGSRNESGLTTLLERTMTEAYVYDAIRTPRGKGKKDGSLYEVKPVDLLSGLLVKLQQRHGFDPAALDDVVMGVVSPVGEQGSVIAKTAVLKAG